VQANQIFLPYSQVDLIFNHKNVWANLQNQNPVSIYYHIHDETKWLPLIADPALPHVLLLEQAKQLLD
jgi:centrosomal protein CEP76